MPGGPSVLPEGVQFAPDAVQALQHALDALGSGLVVAAWYWTERARVELDKLLNGDQEGGLHGNQRTG